MKERCYASCTKEIQAEETTKGRSKKTLWRDVFEDRKEMGIRTWRRKEGAVIVLPRTMMSGRECVKICSTALVISLSLYVYLH